MKIVLATHNQGKVQEFRKMIKSAKLENIEIVGLEQFPEIAPVEEDGETFKENASKKALEVAQQTGLMTLADDSGLEVDYLDNRPGIYSARYAGEEATDDDNMDKLLAEMKDLPAHRRNAHFVCVIALALPEEVIGLFEGFAHGQIGTEKHGNNGFGYDPIFIEKKYQKTYAELSDDIKNDISHRFKAFHKALEVIKNMSISSTLAKRAEYVKKDRSKNER